VDEFYVVKCIGVIGAHGNVPPVGRWLAGFDPNLIPAEDCQGLSTWAIHRSGAIRFRTRDEAQECIDAVPADNPRRADGTANRQLDRYRLVIEHVTPEPAKPRMSLLDEMRLDGIF
jgi:hypothetical protein